MEGSKVCAFFRTDKGCKYGDKCKFSHASSGPQFTSSVPHPRTERSRKYNNNQYQPLLANEGEINDLEKQRGDEPKHLARDNNFHALHYQKQVTNKPKACANISAKENIRKSSTLTVANGWVPPENLQKIETAQGYIHFFPLELTNKDYLRRVLDITAIGIRQRVLEITKQRSLEKISEDNEEDIYYLLKQILGGRGFEDPANFASALTIRQHFADVLAVPVDKISNAAKFLYLRRNQLAHANAYAHSHDLLQSSFTYAIELLECFGISAAKALKSMEALSEQYTAHRRFKHARKRAFGWISNESSADIDAPDQDFLFFDERPFAESELTPSSSTIVIEDANKLTKELCETLQPVNSAKTRLSVRLHTYISDLDELISLRANEHDYEECERLKQLIRSIQSLISDNKLDEHLDYLRTSLLMGVNKTISSLTVEERKAADRQDFATPLTGSSALLQLRTTLMNLKDALVRDLSSFPLKSLSKAKDRPDCSFLWVGKILGKSALGLSKDSNNLNVLDSAHNQWRTDHLPTTKLTFSPLLLKAAAYTASELKAADYTVSELKAAGYTTSELKAAVYTASELKAAGYTASQLKTARYTASELKAARYTVSELKAASYTASNLKDAGYTAYELYHAGYTAFEVKSAGYTASELKDAGYTAYELYHAGYTAFEVKSAGYTASELKDAGYTLQMLKAADYKGSLMKDAGYSTVELKAAGYTASELKAAGYTAAGLKAAGYTASELRSAGYTASELKPVGYTASELKAADYSPFELTRAGYTPYEMLWAALPLT
eukprot:scaffold7359_cov254-Ochromonas_danica.AAC.1